MRVSNIQKFLGGANNVNAVELIRGEQINYEGTVKDSEGTAIDITNYTISATAEFHKADVTIAAGRNGDTLTIESFETTTKADATLTVTKNTDPTTGLFTVTVPEGLADDADTADLDASTSVLVAVVYLKYDDGGTPATIRKSRLLVIIRHAA